jgi:hypothetical protein
LDTAAIWHASFAWDPSVAPASANARPLVVVLGYGIPEQLIYACGTTPCTLLGGSHASCQWSDDAVPRDSDPASRSILGYALRLAARADIDPLFVVPAANDNMRKIAYFLKREGRAVLSVDIPPVATSPTAQQAWERSTEELGDFLFSVINAARLYKLNPDNALEMTNQKFIRRFNYIEAHSIKMGKPLKDMTLEEMDALWNEAKQNETMKE